MRLPCRGLYWAYTAECQVALYRGEGSTAYERVAWLFPGQGAHYPGMGRQLYATQPTFRAAIDRCAALLADHLDQPLLEVLWGDATEHLAHTTYTQPALFAVEWALARLWLSWGLRPSTLVGHSVGEYVAACIAGVFSLEDALRLVAARGRLMQALPEAGSMAAVCRFVSWNNRC